MRRTLTVWMVVLILLGMVPAVAATTQEQPQQQMRAFWVDAYHVGFRTPQQIDKLVADVQRGGMNTIIMQVRQHGDAWYNRRIEPRAANPNLLPADQFDPLDYMIQRAHSAGIQVHAWLVLSVTCRSSDWLWQHPEHVCTSHGPLVGGAERWTTATFDGRQVGDLDFGHPSAVNYLERIVTQLLIDYPALDGLHWDYVRYSGVEYGYNEISLQLFRQANGLPADYRPDPRDSAWSQWRRDRLTETVRRLYIRAKAVKPTIQISAATITWGGLGSYGPNDWWRSSAYSAVFQDWKAWLQEGIIDIAMPMHYFQESSSRGPAWLDGWLAFDRDNTGIRAIVPGLGNWLNEHHEINWQLGRALAPDDRGRYLSGVAFYSYANPVADATPERHGWLLDQLRWTYFGQPAQVPQWPWIYQPTHGMLQGIATVDGVVQPNARVTFIRDGQWLFDRQSAADGWFGAIELPPGSYTIVVTLPDGRQQVTPATVTPGLVTSL
jgi:uncharacterized lipoprotein YddW (UPF0748 family)